MIRFVRDIRLVPIVLFATISLFALKTIGLVAEGRYTLGETVNRVGIDPADITGSVPAPSPVPSPSAGDPARRGVKPSWAQDVFGYPDATGTVPEKKPDPPPPGGAKPKPEEPPKGNAGWKAVPVDTGKRPSPAEQALLERLQERRAELDARARELEMRENLIKAAEKRVEGRIAELKDLESRVHTAAQQRDEGEATRFKNLIMMYENMKAKEAAKIFDRLDIKILVEVATQINPRRMSDILAQMTPEAAEKLTVELAARGTNKDAAALPNIEGKPTHN
jgi:flagellar motility protein MotE (MotC chaperone)